MMENREKAEILLKMFVCYPSARADGEEAKLRMATYLEALSHFSSETLSAGCRREINQGGAFPPSAAQLVARCNEIVAFNRKMTPALPAPSEYAEKMARIEQRTDAERARVKAMYDQFRNNITVEPRDKAKRVPTQAEASEWLEAYRLNPTRDPVAVSDRLTAFLEAMSGHQREAAE